MIDSAACIALKETDEEISERALMDQIGELQAEGFTAGAVARAMDGILTGIIYKLQNHDNFVLAGDDGSWRAATQQVNMVMEHITANIEIEHLIKQFDAILARDAGSGREAAHGRACRECADRIEAAVRQLDGQGVRQIDILPPAMRLFADLILNQDWGPSDCPSAFVREIAPRYRQQRRAYADRIKRLAYSDDLDGGSVH